MVFKTVDDAKKKLNEYFEITPKGQWTITGVCLHCGIHKDTFYEYAKREEYKDIFNTARLMVEHSYELSLRENGRSGDIFALKNFGWTDKTEVETTNTNLNIDMTPEEAEQYLKKEGIKL